VSSARGAAGNRADQSQQSSVSKAPPLASQLNCITCRDNSERPLEPVAQFTEHRCTNARPAKIQLMHKRHGL
jgi:hypothetical protein